MIQGGSEIVHYVSSNRHDFKRKGRNPLKLIRMQEGYGMRSNTRTWIGGEYCRVLKGEDFGCEITKVLLGPLDLHPDKDNSVVRI